MMLNKKQLNYKSSSVINTKKSGYIRNFSPVIVLALKRLVITWSLRKCINSEYLQKNLQAKRCLVDAIAVRNISENVFIWLFILTPQTVFCLTLMFKQDPFAKTH